MVRRADKGRRDRRASEGSMGVCGGAARSDVSSFEKNGQQRDRRLISFSGKALPSRHARLMVDNASSKDFGQVES